MPVLPPWSRSLALRSERRRTLGNTSYRRPRSSCSPAAQVGATAARSWPKPSGNIRKERGLRRPGVEPDMSICRDFQPQTVNRACLKIVVSPVRVRVSPSEEALEIGAFFRTGGSPGEARPGPKSSRVPNGVPKLFGTRALMLPGPLLCRGLGDPAECGEASPQRLGAGAIWIGASARQGDPPPAPWLARRLPRAAPACGEDQESGTAGAREPCSCVNSGTPPRRYRDVPV